MGDINKSPRVQIPKSEDHALWLEDYIGGMSYRAVGAKYGVHHSAVYGVVQRQLAKARERRDGLADLYLDLQIARYTDLYRRCIDELNSSEDGREVGKAQLVSAARGALDSLTRILGLDHGITVNVHTETALDRELADLTKQMGRIINGDTVDTPELAAGTDDSTDDRTD